MENIDIPEYEIEGLLQTLNELGIKGIMEWSDVLVLNHLQERGFIPSERDKVINVLKEQTDMSYGQIVELLQRYDKWKVVLPSYSLGLNLKLDSVNKMFNSVVPFRWLGTGPNKKLIGIVKEGKEYTIYDNTGKHPMLVGKVNERFSIVWNNYVKLTTPQSKYIIDEVKRLKERIM
jgi:hypothetical protein